MKLSENFTLHEFTRSNKATQLGIDNTPPEEIMPRLIELAKLAEAVRAKLGYPMTPTSGYRCRALNLAVGGSETSDHATGRAFDFVCPEFGAPYEIAKYLAPKINELGIGQLIYEKVDGKEWVHVSNRIPEKLSNRVITIYGKAKLLGIVKLN